MKLINVNCGKKSHTEEIAVIPSVKTVSNYLDIDSLLNDIISRDIEVS